MDGIQGILGIPGEPGDGLCNDQFDIPCQGIGDHPDESSPAVDGCAGDTLVGIDSYVDPLWAIVAQLF